MAKTYINEKIWYDPEVSNYVMLDVTEEVGEQQPLEIDDTLLLPKNEYHVTLVAAGKITGKDTEQTARLISDIEGYLHDNPEAVKFGSLGDERFVCRDGEEATLIAPATIIGIEGLRKVVLKRVPDYKPAFTHVTLLKNEESPYGIGVNSQDDFDQLCKKYNMPK